MNEDMCREPRSASEETRSCVQESTVAEVEAWIPSAAAGLETRTQVQVLPALLGTKRRTRSASGGRRSKLAPRAAEVQRCDERRGMHQGGENPLHLIVKCALE